MSHYLRNKKTLHRIYQLLCKTSSPVSHTIKTLHRINYQLHKMLSSTNIPINNGQTIHPSCSNPQFPMTTYV